VRAAILVYRREPRRASVVGVRSRRRSRTERLDDVRPSSLRAVRPPHPN
jgi:hypothetical protein